jgi:hypothetical protein
MFSGILPETLFSGDQFIPSNSEKTQYQFL